MDITAGIFAFSNNKSRAGGVVPEQKVKCINCLKAGVNRPFKSDDERFERPVNFNS